MRALLLAWLQAAQRRVLPAAWGVQARRACKQTSCCYCVLQSARRIDRGGCVL
jgi:hypothetical protein